MTEIEIEWSEPPPRVTAGGKYKPFIDALRAKPNQWGSIPYGGKSPDGVSATAASLRKSNPGFEFTTRKSDGKARIWGRYVPPKG